VVDGTAGVDVPVRRGRLAARPDGVGVVYLTERGEVWKSRVERCCRRCLSAASYITHLIM